MNPFKFICVLLHVGALAVFIGIENYALAAFAAGMTLAWIADAICDAIKERVK